MPYTDAAWATICEAGAKVAQRLAAGDVRLTVGGEPTFVSIDNQVDQEWATAADGPHKRQRASDLAARLKGVWAPTGLVHRGRSRRFATTGFTPGQVDLSDLREKQARLSTDVGAPGILDLRRVRTVLR